MQSYTNKKENAGSINNDRIKRLKESVMTSSPGICVERALIWTRYFRSQKNRKKSPHIYIAQSLSKVLNEKSISIYPDELIVGNFSSKRVGGSIYPELHGVPVLLDLFKFSSRKTNPLEIDKKDIWSLLKIIPFWLFRFLGMKAYTSFFRKIRFITDQIKAHYYLVNETGGISHIAPDYASLLRYGAEGYAAKAEEFQKTVGNNSESWYFYEGIKIICEGISSFGDRYADMAEKMSLEEKDPSRKSPPSAERFRVQKPAISAKLYNPFFSYKSPSISKVLTTQCLRDAWISIYILSMNLMFQREH
jgi:hypothetical protein